VPSETPVLREMTTGDVPAVMAVQEPTSIAGLSGVFPQDEYPFPRQVLADRWRAEIADADIDCFVILRDDEVAGFAAVQADQVKHFGVAVEEWGSGLATTAHDELVERMGSAGVQRAWLCVYEANPRGRAFWAKLGWTDTGVRSGGPMPPHAEQLILEKSLPPR
jgi:RimJ/RimL family protein N-acetyltransferase